MRSGSHDALEKAGDAEPNRNNQKHLEQRPRQRDLHGRPTAIPKISGENSLAGILLPARYRIRYFHDGHNEGPDHNEILNRQAIHRDRWS